MGLWVCQQGFTLCKEWWIGGCFFHVFYFWRHILRLNDNTRITFCSSQISMKNKTKKEAVSVHCQTWKCLFKKASTTNLRAKCWLPVGWVGGGCLKDLASRHWEAVVTLEYCCYWFMSWGSHKLFNKVQSQEETYSLSSLRPSKNWW